MHTGGRRQTQLLFKQRISLCEIQKIKLAEREGFEPPDPLQNQRFSRPPLSTTQPPLPKRIDYYTLKKKLNDWRRGRDSNILYRISVLAAIRPLTKIWTKRINYYTRQALALDADEICVSMS